MLQVQVHFGEAGMQMWQVLQVVKNNIALSSMMAQQVPKCHRSGYLLKDFSMQHHRNEHASGCTQALTWKTSSNVWKCLLSCRLGSNDWWTSDQSDTDMTVCSMPQVWSRWIIWRWRVQACRTRHLGCDLRIVAALKEVHKEINPLEKETSRNLKKF